MRSISWSRPRRAALPVLAVVLVAAGVLVALRFADAGTPARAGTDWTVVSEHSAVIWEEAPWLGAGMTAETRSAARIWFLPEAGWRMEIESSGAHGRGHRVLTTDGATVWTYDPASNRYTAAAGNGALIDPRAGMAVMMATAGTHDLDSAIASLQRIPDVTVTLEGHEVIAGRAARVLVVSPHSCWEIGQSWTGGATRTERGCGGHTRYWLDQTTGWVLQAVAEDGRGGGFRWETQSIAFDAEIDPALFRFTPPPGSVKVDQLD